jgi:3-oxoacyl-(acyl-carrier-protein) synthase
LVAALNAWRQAGLDGFAGFDGSRMGLYMGSGEGPLDIDTFAAARACRVSIRRRGASTTARSCGPRLAEWMR